MNRVTNEQTYEFISEHIIFEWNQIKKILYPLVAIRVSARVSSLYSCGIFKIGEVFTLNSRNFFLFFFFLDGAFGFPTAGRNP